MHRRHFLQSATGSLALLFASPTVAAAEVGLALAIIINLFRSKGSVDIDKIDVMRW